MLRLTPKGRSVAENINPPKDVESAVLAYLYETGDTEPEELFGELRFDDEKGLRVIGRLVNKGYLIDTVGG